MCGRGLRRIVVGPGPGGAWLHHEVYTRCQASGPGPIATQRREARVAFASDTKVPVDRSRTEIETTLKRYGCTAFAFGWSDAGAIPQLPPAVEPKRLRAVNS